MQQDHDQVSAGEGERETERVTEAKRKRDRGRAGESANGKGEQLPLLRCKTESGDELQHFGCLIARHGDCSLGTTKTKCVFLLQLMLV